MICRNSELRKKCAQNVQGNLCINAMKYLKYDMPYLAVSRLTDHGGTSVNTDSKEKSMVNLCVYVSPHARKSFFVIPLSRKFKKICV